MRLPPPESEGARLRALGRYQILGTPPEEAFDNIARLAAYVCGTPIALISFIDLDSQWFKSKVGWDVAEIPRNVALCAHTILQSEVVVVADTLADEVTKTSPLATHGGLRFYAGVPLLTPEGYALGTLCVMDSVQRDLSGEQRQALLRLAWQVMSILDLRRISGQQVAPQSDFTGGLEPKPAGSALSESDIYGAVTRAASDAIIVVDEQSTILFANRSIERILGYRAEELLGQQLTVLMPDSLPPVSRQAMRENLETGEKHIFWQQVVPALHKSGQAVDLEVSFGEFVSGGERLFTGICRDVTERKRIEEQRVQLAALVASSEGAVIGKNLDGMIATWNSGANRIYGYRPEEILGKHISILTPPERPDEVPLTMEKLRRGERAELYETVRITKDGRRIHVSLTVSPIRDNAGRITGVSSVDRDITDRKLVEMRLQEQEKALRSSEQRYRSLFEGMVHGIYRLGREGEFLEVNPALVEMLGYNFAGEVLKLNPATELYLDPQENPRLVQKWLEETNIEDEVKWRRRDGTIITVRLNGRTLTDEGGVVLGFEFIAEDVTERRSLEHELRQVQKIEAVDQLAGGIAHEFNNYLGVILGYSALLVEEAGTNESLRRAVAEIKAATQRAASLSRSLLAFSRKQVLEPTILDLNHAILEALKLLQRLVPANIEIVPLLDPALGRVKADPGQIQQILINLVINARDAMPLGGKITVETTNRELDEFYCSQHHGIQIGTHLLLAVAA